jgi:predicted RNA-binding Zn-ribbon protein involved in translation (DUF1610 family)
MEKYSKDGEFTDPIVRCTECQGIIFREKLQTIGMCPKCGNRRVRNVLTMNEKELAFVKEKGIDPDFLKLFEMVEE